MASKSRDCRNVSAGKKGDSSSGSSESSNSEEEERLRRLFTACDRDGDGFIDSRDVLVMCQELNMEEAVEEIMAQLGVDEQGRISFQEFSRCRNQLMSEIEQEKLRETLILGPVMRSSPQHRHSNTTANWTSESRQAGSASAWPVEHPQPGSGSNWRTDSDNSLGAMPDSVDYDSGARDMSPEPVTLYKLIENHDPETFHRMVEAADNYTRQGVPNFLDVANSLHLTALSSLKGEIVELSNRLQLISKEKDSLEHQLNKQQGDKLRIQRESEVRFDQQTARYEERITELHSVIAELRKKLDRNHINIIREEEEEEGDFEGSDEAQSSRSGHEAEASLNEAEASFNEGDNDIGRNEENLPKPTTTTLAELAPDLNAELSRVVSELESAIEERKSFRGSGDLVPSDVDNVERKAIEVCQDMDNFSISPTPPAPFAGADTSQYEKELQHLRNSNCVLQETLRNKEAQANKVKLQMGTIREERDRLRRRVRELQTRLQSLDAVSPMHSRTSTPTIGSSNKERSISETLAQHTTVAKVAELKKLKTGDYGSHVVGPELSNSGLPNTKVAEHLVQSLQECSNMQEIVQAVYKCGNEMSDSKVKEFEIEFERLQSKIDHLKAQNDLLTATLEESKDNCDRMTVLMGKYESNSTAHQLVVNISDQALEAYEVLALLMEAELKVLLANCRSAGLGFPGSEPMDVEDQEEMSLVLQRAHINKRVVENMAKQLLQKVDRQLGVHVPGGSPVPWDDISSASRTASSTTSSTGSSADTEFTKHDEMRLRDYIHQLKNERSSVKLSVLELESIMLDPMCSMPRDPNSQKLDLENAVLMQELMAMKEDKAELKAQNYLLEKENGSLELQLSGKQSREQSYIIQIEHLKSEVKDQADQVQKMFKDPKSKKEGDALTPSITLAELRSHAPDEIAQDLAEALKREQKLKHRISELVITLEKLSQNSEVRHQQSAEFVSDLKRANSALVAAFEKAKKKYQGRIRKLEVQLSLISEKSDFQAHLYKQRIETLEDEITRISSNETSL